MPRTLTNRSGAKVFDWVLAAQIIKDTGCSSATAGLLEDWDWTSGLIFDNGKIVPIEDTYVFLASTWATPSLILGNGLIYDCFVAKDERPEWNSGTYWPKEAIDILSSNIITNENSKWHTKLLSFFLPQKPQS